MREHMRLYLVADPAFAGTRRLPDIVAAAVRGGVTMVQLRDKGDHVGRFVQEARAVRQVLEGTGVPLIINDRVDVAHAIGADGVHLGQRDLPVRDARRLLGREAIIGLSIEQAAQLAHADLAAVDYLGAGPVFATATKPDAAPPLGLDGLAAIRTACGLPVVAIGGLSLDNAAGVIAAGADGIAVVSAVMAAHDVTHAAAQLRARIGG
ncbi:thiamine phosphate synthase [Vineibacter terrae]|uniref:Thiamine-phosphate synthase n=1 Tax=Vineibacter terrae TaxID=2586908 RepID=A0A5C8PEE5_9HYPH|nr:thiamine phosphate synthase [Vineibacter terrae]TXL71709.1 thiamine phosphate synthase [Vineibacter terrae]